jgi:hypothetical protein
MNVERLRLGGRTLAATLALLAALAIGAVGASGAQALTWRHSAGPQLMSGSESETVASSEGTISLGSKVGGAPVQFTCKAASSGTIKAGRSGTSSISLSNCVVAQPANCAVVIPTPLQANVELIEVGGSRYQKFTPTTGGSFGKVQFAWSGTGRECVIEGNEPALRGSFAGRELTSELAANHPLSFTKSESWPEVGLTFGAGAATMTGNLVQHLSGLLEGGVWQGTSEGWRFEPGSPFTTSQSVRTLGGPINFHFSFVGSPVSFTCGEAAFHSAYLVPGGTESIGELAFTACKVEKAATGCYLEGNQLVTAPVTGTLMQVNGKVYMKFTPVGSEFGVFGFQGDCGMAGIDRALTGSFAAVWPESGVMKQVHGLEFSEAAEMATGSEFRWGASLVFMSGSVEQEASGALWGVYN